MSELALVAHTAPGVALFVVGAAVLLLVVGEVAASLEVARIREEEAQ